MKQKQGYSAYRWLVLMVGAIGSITFGMHMIYLAPILPQVAKDLGINMGTAANLFTSFLLSSAVVLLFAGVVCDKLGIRTGLVLGLLCVSAPALLMPWIGHSYRAVFLLRLIQGASPAFIITTAGPILALWFPPEEVGFGSGIIIGGVSVGFALGVVLSPVLLKMTGTWQATSALLSIVGWVAIVLAVLIAGKKPPAPHTAAIEETPVQSAPPELAYRRVILSSPTWIATLILFFGNWTFMVLCNLVPAYLAAPAPTGLGFGAMLSGKLSLALTVVGVFATFAGGIFHDKVARGDARISLLIGFALTGVFAYLLVVPHVYSSMPLLVISLMAAGWVSTFMQPAANAYIIAAFPANLVGRMVGLCYGLGQLGGALGVYIGAALIARSGNFNLTIVSISLAAVPGVIVALLARIKPAQVEEPGLI